MGAFIPAAQLPIEPLTEDPSIEPQNEELVIIDTLVEVKDGYEFREVDNGRGQLHQPAEVKGNLRRNTHRSAQIYFLSYC